MDYQKIEPELKQSLHEVLKARTGIFLDFIDALAENPTNTLVEVKRLESIKVRGKKLFMESQNEILGLIKNVLTTGEVPKGIDKRGSAKVQN